MRNGELLSGQICCQTQPLIENILQLQERSRGNRDGCIQSELVRPICVRIPLFPASGENPSGNQERESPQGYSDCTSMGETSLVPAAIGNVNSLTNLSSSVSQSHSGSLGKSPSTAISTTPTADCMVSVRNSLHSQGVSEQATDLICASLRKGTEKAYNSIGMEKMV